MVPPVIGASQFSSSSLRPCPKVQAPSPKQEAEEEGGGDSRRSNATHRGREGREEREGERGASPLPPPRVRIKLYLDRNRSSSPSVPDSWSRGRHKQGRQVCLQSAFFLFLSPPLYPIPRSSPFFFFFQAFPLLTPFERGDVGGEKRRIAGRKRKSDNEADQSVCVVHHQLAGGDSNEPKVGVVN